MKSQMVFQRYELKYRMNRRQQEAILAAMEPYMVADEYGHSSIRNLYLDTPDFRLIRRSLEKPVYKEKLWVRSYGRAGEEDPVFVELKKKYRSVVYKRRIALPQNQAMSCLLGDCPWPDTQIGRELGYAAAYYPLLRPAVFLSYERDAYTITAASQGLSAKDSLAIAGGSFVLTTDKDGIHVENTEDTSLGSLTIAGGTFSITAQGDAISASGAAQIDGGTFQLTTGEGSASVTMSSSDAGGFGFWEGAASADTVSEEEDTTSQKGIKAEGAFTITGGTFTMDKADDCLHAGGDLTISSGEFTLSSGDDAVHSDGAVSIADGTFTIPYCYEGIEGASITIDGGTFDITSYDDGFNAAGGADSSGFGGRSPDQFTANADVFIIINGGTFTIVSEGDCVDSNGDLTINGGTLDLTCNGNGDTALDTDGTYTNNGGDVTTNDGSESNPGGMPGGQGGGQFGGRQPGEGQFDGGQPPEGQPGGGELPDRIPEEGMEPPSTL